MLSVSLQQEGLDDGPDFLSEEDRGVSAHWLPVCVYLSVLNCLSGFFPARLKQLISLSSGVVAWLAVFANVSYVLTGC